MRGGVSGTDAAIKAGYRSSPHAWGCFQILMKAFRKIAVFPTCVGVFLGRVVSTGSINCLPHMRGGVSSIPVQHHLRLQSSPHAWGCFYAHPCALFLVIVFPTCVGVFLFILLLSCDVISLPHMRGGVSWTYLLCRLVLRSSPHAWGCF